MPDVVPAHAGVIPALMRSDAAAISGSRTRGGDPLIVLHDHLATGWFPHTRG